MENNPQPEEPMNQDPGVSGHMIPVNRFSAANDLMFEDCLKSILLKAKTGKTYCPYKNRYCPKPMQSPFGDFPPEYLPVRHHKNFNADPNATAMSSKMHSITFPRNAYRNT